jgi:hypothetical protein
MLFRLLGQLSKLLRLQAPEPTVLCANVIINVPAQEQMEDLVRLFGDDNIVKPIGI